MKYFVRAALFAALAAALAPAAALAERIVRINGSAGVFSQPSIVQDGSIAHVAFVGADTAAGPFRVFYAAVRLGADFSSLTLSTADFRNQVLVAPPVPVADNVALADNTYADARHPKIALRASGQPVIFFQARPGAVTDNVFALYRALITAPSGQATAIDVRQVRGNVTPGDIEDAAYGLVAADNTARIAYSSRSAIDAAGEPFQVFFARIGLDNALVSGTPLPLSLPFLAGGSRPTPDLRLDGLARSHIAWSLDDGSGSGDAGIAYAMIKEVSGADNAVIPATRIMTRVGARWVHPSILILPAGPVVVTAADGSIAGAAGEVGFVQLSPDVAKQDGNPVDTGIGGLNAFLVVPPGQAILSGGVRLYRPLAVVDSSNRIHMTGVGGPRSFSQYLAFHLVAAAPHSELLTPPTSIGLDNNAFAAEIPGGAGYNFTQVALLHLDGAALVAWSGTDNVDPALSNINVSAVPALKNPPAASQESGCSVTGRPAGEGAAAITRAALFLIPAIVLWARRRIRRRGLAK